tara:strand:+ start:1024 stop:2790 length:1767 start_codon:yes stop_codon:yes gene_type:complete
MKKNGQTLKETFLTAVENFKKKNFKNAEIICYKILSIDSNHFDSLSLLATISAINGNFKDAIESLKKAINIQPQNTKIIHNLGTAYKELGKLEEAENYYRKVLGIDPNHTNANYNLGLIFYGLKELKKAKSYFQKTIEIQSNYAIAFFSLGNVHVDLKEFEEAVSCYQKAIEIKPNFVGAINNLGLAFKALNDFENTINCYQKAIKIKPDHAGAHHNLAQAYKEMGQFDQAIQSHQKAIKYEPENLSNFYFLSELKKDILDSTLKDKITKTIINKKSGQRNLAYGNYLLAKYERKSKNYETELNFLIKGHKNFFNSEKAKFDIAIKYCFKDVIQIMKKAKVEKLIQKKENNIKPIFIVGVPRCGSTLVEKIIASGKKYIALGEETTVLENFINKKILDKKSFNLGDVTEIRNELNNIYKRKGLVLKKYDYIFTDKTLNNFFYLDLIKDIYPEAKIINCKRGVIPSIMSIFQNNLTELAWTHDLDNIFKYFDNYFKIIENCKSAHNNIFYELQFEELINNPEEESKKLMKFCELPWDKKCLEFYKRKDLISKTASNIQIREAIYKHLPEKYTPYKKFLDRYGKKYSWYN